MEQDNKLNKLEKIIDPLIKIDDLRKFKEVKTIISRVENLNKFY